MKNIIAVIGPTGVGKSNLAVQIALAFNGEIINADSMQVYKGLDIITNKMSVKERNGITHHLMDEIEPMHEFTVQDWTSKASNIISEIHSRNKLPILVGGTHYYLQSILTSQLIHNQKEGSATLDPVLMSNIKLLLENSKLDPNSFAEELSKTLKVIDPVMGRRWHPKDGRKIRRSLEVFYTTGQKQSEIILNQSSNLKYRTCIVWPFMDKEFLDSRLDARIDDMIKLGLLEEIETFYNISLKGSLTELDFTRGILQAIGFKEFYEYLETRQEKSLMNGIELMKLHTRQYARRQITWIKNKIVAKLQGPMISLIAKDVTDLSKWEEHCASTVKSVEKFLNGDQVKELPETIGLNNTPINTNILEWEQFECKICKVRNTNLPRIFNGHHEWTTHLNSRTHKKNTQYLQGDMHKNPIKK